MCGHKIWAFIGGVVFRFFVLISWYSSPGVPSLWLWLVVVVGYSSGWAGLDWTGISVVGGGLGAAFLDHCALLLGIFNESLFWLTWRCYLGLGEEREVGVVLRMVAG